jgi:hypothetical protein
MFNFIFWSIMGATISCLYSLLRVVFVYQSKELSFSVNINRIIAGFVVGQSLFLLLLSRYENKNIFLFEIIIFLLLLLYFVLIFIEDFKTEKIKPGKIIETIVLVVLIGFVILKSVQYLIFL